MTNPIKFVSLGPGEADLITVKGFKALQHADIIYCPGTVKESEDNSSLTVSRSGDILTILGIPGEKIEFFSVPMSKHRDAANLAYDNVLMKSKEMFHCGKKVAIVAEGDAGFYSSIHYIHDKLTHDCIPVETIAGVPAFIAGGAFAGMHIVKQEEPLLVFPGIVTPNDIKEAVYGGKTVVIMKLSQCENAVKECIEDILQDKTSEKGGLSMFFHYMENIGTPNQLYLSNLSDIYNRKFPYFSLMVIKGVI